jgi:integrase
MNQLREGQPHRKKYSTLVEDLKEYSTYMRPSLRIADIDHAWQIDFALYLLEKRPEYSGKKTVMLSVVDKKIGCIRTALRELDDTYTLAKNYRKPLRLAKDSPQPLKQTLTVEEIEQLMKVDFIQNQLNEARDWFVIGCWTALRQKDLLSLTENDFYREGDFLWLRKTQAKTRGTVDICLHPHVSEIMERHGGLPPRMTVEASHRRLPKLLALCGLFDQMVPGSVRQYFTNDKGKGELRVEIGTYPRYACMGWHTARRTCATNLVKRGVALDVVQQFTGHSTITQLLEYVKVTPEQSRLRMENVIKAFA